jgi:hypothetical protein
MTVAFCRIPEGELIVIKTKSVFSAIEPRQDGLRILVARFRGRGMPASRYHVWI